MILWAHNYHIARSEYNHALYPDIKAWDAGFPKNTNPIFTP